MTNNPTKELSEMVEGFEEKWKDKGDERYGLVKHNNAILKIQLDEIQDMLSTAYSLGIKQERERVKKWAEERWMSSKLKDSTRVEVVVAEINKRDESGELAREIQRLGLFQALDDLLTYLEVK